MARRILLLDDEVSIRRAIRRTLLSEGYEIYDAASPHEAMEILAVQPIDLAIVDHCMPGMTGLEFCERIRKTHPDVCRIIFTGFPDTEIVIRAINEGEIYRFITKPCDLGDLRATLRNAFEHLELQAENRRLLATVKRQSQQLLNLERDFPGISSVPRDEGGAVLIQEDELRSLMGDPT